MVDLHGGEVRKTVTVLFCDVTGSTSLGEQLDPESLRSLMSRFFEEMQAVLERHGGTVEKYIGDAVMAVFGIPAVHEDDALRAVRAAVEMRDALASLNKELERDRGVTIASRIGVNTGEVVAGDAAARQSLVTGDAVNVAARLEQAAGPGEILIGAPTMSLVRDAVVAEAIEPLTLKGKTGTVAAFRLVEVGRDSRGVARRLDAPMVGRARELDALREAFARAARDRSCVLATILGAPGVGKSRLTEEFLAGLPDDSVVVRGRCLSYGEGITYWPVVEMLTAVAGLLDTDGPVEIRSKIEALLHGTDEAAIASVRLAEFLGLAGATASPEETHWAIRKLFEALAAERPLVAVFDDIHWAEPGLLDLIEHIAEWTRDAPILLVCPARPDLLDVRPGLGGQTMGPTLLLEPLSEAESDQLIAGLLGRSDTPVNMAARVREAAEGNPLFVEQMVAMLIDDGLVRSGPDGWEVTGDLSSLKVPPTIAGLLQARLDRLSPEEQRVIERGSVEGRIFHWGSVTDLSSDLDPGAVGRHLMSLRRRDLIGPEQAQFGGSQAFRFRHALIRDAAYERIPKRTRSELHERHARWLERIAGARQAEFQEVLAYHLEQAVTLRADLGPLDDAGRRLADEAARRLASAGLRAEARGDYAATTTLLDRALRLLDQDDPTRPDLLARFARVVNESGDPDRAATLLDEAGSLALRRGDCGVVVRARVLRVQLKTLLEPEGSTEELDEVLSEAIPLLEELDDDDGLVIAWLAASQLALIRGRASEMEPALERAAFHAERADDQGNLSDALAYLIGLTSIGADRPEEALEKIPRIRERQLEDRKVEAIALIYEAMAMAKQGRFEDARERYRRGFGGLEDLGARMWTAGARYSTGWIELMAGDLAEAERELRKGIDELRSMGEQAYLSTQAALLAEVLYAQDRLEEADEMAGMARGTGASDDLSTQWQSRAVQAKVLARRGGYAAAIGLGQEAAAITEPSDFALDRTASLMDLGEVYRLADRTLDAARALRGALEVAEATGIVPLIERIRSRLASLGAES